MFLNSESKVRISTPQFILDKLYPYFEKNKLSIFQRIGQLPVTGQIIDWTKTHSFPGFRGVPIFQVFAFLVHEARRNDLNMRASAMTYHFFSLVSIFDFFLYADSLFTRES